MATASVQKRYEWRRPTDRRYYWPDTEDRGRYKSELAACAVLDDDSQVESATVDSSESITIEQQFLELADKWTERTIHISSASDLVNDRCYREIIDLGWDVVPYLIRDLKKNKRYWFPALAEITRLHPFDQSDRNNSRRMAEAWIRWGKLRGYKLD